MYNRPINSSFCLLQHGTAITKMCRSFHLLLFCLVLLNLNIIPIFPPVKVSKSFSLLRPWVNFPLLQSPNSLMSLTVARPTCIFLASYLVTVLVEMLPDDIVECVLEPCFCSIPTHSCGCHTYCLWGCACSCSPASPTSFLQHQTKISRDCAYLLPGLI